MDHREIFRLIESLERLALQWFETSSRKEREATNREFSGIMLELLNAIPDAQEPTKTYVKAISAQGMHQAPELTAYTLYAQCDLAITGTIDMAPLQEHHQRLLMEYHQQQLSEGRQFQQDNRPVLQLIRGDKP